MTPALPNKLVVLPWKKFTQILSDDKTSHHFSGLTRTIYKKTTTTTTLTTTKNPHD
jgi:hypothetical protein